jgi:release factor glutamine methyltransferase
MTEDEIILTHILQCRSIDLVINKPVLTVSQKKQFEDYKRRRQAGEPLQYILGTCNFMGLELTVNPSVLVPRPETEQLVDAAIKYFEVEGNSLLELKGTVPFKRILDLGTGSGNIANALAKFVPQSQVVSVDISAQALEVARANARRHRVEDRIQFIQDDMLMSLRGAEGDAAISEQGLLRFARNDRFDLIISNPPYIPTSHMKNIPKDVQQEPVLALDGGEEGLNFYRIIIKYSPRLLRKGACLMMEFGDGQAEAIKKLVKAQKVFSSIEIIKDLSGRDRIIAVKMLG